MMIVVNYLPHLAAFRPLLLLVLPVLHNSLLSRYMSTDLASMHFQDWWTIMGSPSGNNWRGIYTSFGREIAEIVDTAVTLEHIALTSNTPYFIHIR